MNDSTKELSDAVRRNVPLRSCISEDPSETAVFAVDVIAQPQYRAQYFETDPLVHTKCSRALPVAHDEDIVVLAGRLDQQYYRWLRGLGLGPAHVVEYGQEQTSASLAEMIAANPTPVLDAIERLGKRPVYVPFYSGAAEEKAAAILGADLFGCSEAISLRYFDKDSFKEVCVKLGIPVVDGQTHTKSDRLAAFELSRVILELLSLHPSLIIRGTIGAAGSSIYRIDSPDYRDVINVVRQIRDDSVLIEPFLKTIASPNDQWAITRSGGIAHLGISAQLFKELKHVGNLQGQYFSDRVSSYIGSTSHRIVKEMASQGYRGIVGIDYLVADEGIFPIENNARMNGSSFTLALVDNLAVRHGPIPCWKFFRARAEQCEFPGLAKKLEPILYNGASINAVFPYDCDTLRQRGLFAAVILGEDLYHVQYLEDALLEFGIEKI